MKLSEVHVKCPVMLICPPGDGIEVDWFYMRTGMTVQPVCCASWSGGKSLWTNRSFNLTNVDTELLHF